MMSRHQENVNFIGRIARNEFVVKEQFLSHVKPHYHENSITIQCTQDLLNI